MADFKDFILIFFAGLVIGYVLRGSQGSTAVRYSNSEEWEFIRDKDGRTRGVRVHRTVEES